MLTQVDRKCVAQVVEWLELFLEPKLLSGSFPNGLTFGKPERLQRKSKGVLEPAQLNESSSSSSSSSSSLSFIFKTFPSVTLYVWQDVLSEYLT